MFSFKIPTFWHTLKKPFNGKGEAITVVQCLIHGKLAKPYAIPFAVVTNGDDVHILEIASGKVIVRGLESILSRVDMARQLPHIKFNDVAENRLEKEKRILFMYEAVATCSLPG